MKSIDLYLKSWYSNIVANILLAGIITLIVVFLFTNVNIIDAIGKDVYLINYTYSFIFFVTLVYILSFLLYYYDHDPYLKKKKLVRWIFKGMTLFIAAFGFKVYFYSLFRYQFIHDVSKYNFIERDLLLVLLTMSALLVYFKVRADEVAKREYKRNNHVQETAHQYAIAEHKWAYEEMKKDLIANNEETLRIQRMEAQLQRDRLVLDFSDQLAFQMLDYQQTIERMESRYQALCTRQQHFEDIVAELVKKIRVIDDYGWREVSIAQVQRIYICQKVLKVRLMNGNTHVLEERDLPVIKGLFPHLLLEVDEGRQLINWLSFMNYKKSNDMGYVKLFGVQEFDVQISLTKYDELLQKLDYYNGMLEQ
ncbi:hypothetical protein ACFX5U_17085 [Sphingobacterium sp. SG20118]|uniref:hypothetical protein n=1 Tax=Sphingobacterium sp. SG20118 TaxID=3367156 RepID=UPI0037DFC603